MGLSSSLLLYQYIKKNQQDNNIMHIELEEI